MPPKTSPLRTVARVALGSMLVGAGASHLTVARTAFQAQVPEQLVKLLPVSTDDVVLASGVVEIGLGTALLGLPKERHRVGSVVAAFFVAVFPGNVSQLLKHADAFGLDTDRKRVVRLFFQPLLVLWALFAGGVI